LGAAKGVNCTSEPNESKPWSRDIYLLSHAHPELHAAEFVVFTDASRRYVDCTDGVCRLLGYDRAEILAQTIDDVSFHGSEVSKLFAEYLQRGQMNGEYVLRHKNGAPIPIRYRAFVFADGCAAAVWDPVKDWRELYLSALVEIDAVKLKRKIEVALQAVQQRMHELKNVSGASQQEQQSLRDAASALQSLSRSA
jgi:PAS domain-containing protein